MKSIQLELYNTNRIDRSGILYFRLYEEPNTGLYVFGVIYTNAAVTIDLKSSHPTWNDQGIL